MRFTIILLLLILVSCSSVPSKITQSKTVGGFSLDYNEDKRTVEIVSFPANTSGVILSMIPCYMPLGFDMEKLEGIVYIVGPDGKYQPKTLYALYRRPINIRYLDLKTKERNCVNTGIFFRE